MNEWITDKTDMPPLGERVILTVKNCKGGKHVVFGEAMDGKWLSEPWWGPDYEVLGWMHKPEPAEG